MIHLFALTAAAVLMAAPALAQSATSDSMSSQTGREESLVPPQTGQAPLDCQPYDARPECQTAQVPEPDEEGVRPPSDVPPEATEDRPASPSLTPERDIDGPSRLNEPQQGE